MRNLSYFILAMGAFIAVGFWWLPPDLKSPITHSGWFRAVASVFGSDTRIMIADNSYPWRSIGLVHGNASASWMCTGFLIGPDTVATSRHCVLDESGQLRRDVRYSVVRNTHYGRLTHPARRIRTLPITTDVAEGAFDGGDPAFDLAVLEIADNVGASVGYFGTVHDGSFSRSRDGMLAEDESNSVDELCSDTITELPWRAADRATPVGNELGLNWVAPDRTDPPRICAAGFSGDLGYVRLSVANACGLLGMSDGIVIHNCVISNGASGGPLFYLDRSGSPVAFATNTATAESDPIGDFFGEDQLSLGTLLTELVD